MIICAFLCHTEFDRYIQSVLISFLLWRSQDPTIEHTWGYTPAKTSVSSTWSVCPVFLKRAITCSYRVYLRIKLVLRRWVIRPWHLIILCIHILLFTNERKWRQYKWLACGRSVSVAHSPVTVGYSWNEINLLYSFTTTDLCKPNFIFEINTGIWFRKYFAQKSCIALPYPWVNGKPPRKHFCRIRLRSN